MKKIRFRGSECALSPQIILSSLILLCLKAKANNNELVNVCEFDDVNVLFPNTPAESLGDITAKTWNKENGIRLASWMADTNFVANSEYGGRLTAVGENSIKIKNVTRADAGRYTLVLTTRSSQNFIEFMVDLAVLASPSNQCVPIISHEADTLMVQLPAKGCGIPSLTPRWINHSQNLINGNTNVLKLDSDVEQGIYIACAAGDAIRCFHENTTQLCANYTKGKTTIEIEPENLTKILIPLGIACIALIAVIISVVIKRRSRRAALSDALSIPEEQTLITVNTTKEDLKDPKQHLIDQYKRKNGEYNSVAVRPVYNDYEITYQQTDFAHDKGTVNGSFATLKDLLRIDENDVNTARRTFPIPTIILGQCGSGKSTWCQILVQEWCSYHENIEMNRNVKNANKPEVAKFEILLFVPLQNTLQWSTFDECLKATLFCNDDILFQQAKKYLLKHGESVLVILDGLDAVTQNLKPIVNLLNDRDFSPCTIVLTSRQDGLNSLRADVKGTMHLFHLHGMSLVRARDYAEMYIKWFNRHDLTFDSYWNSLRDLQLQTLCQVPFIGFSLIDYFRKKADFPNNMVDIILTLIECHIRRAKSRKWFRDNIDRVMTNNEFDISKYFKEVKDKDELFREYGYLLKALSIVARKIWSLDNEKAIAITKVTGVISKECVQLCIETGILIETTEKTRWRRLTKIAFRHIIFLDFFVALYLALRKQNSSSTHDISLDDKKHDYIIRMLEILTRNTGHEMSDTGVQSAIDV